MSKEKVVLIYPPPLIDARGVNTATMEPSLGLVYIATSLQREKIPVQVIDANITRLDYPEVIEAIGTKSPLIIGLTANIPTYQSALFLARHLRIRFPDSMIVFGGPHPSSIPREALGEDWVDIVVIGEGENTVLELVRTLKKGESLEKVDGIAFKSNSRMIFNKSRSLIEDLDTLPIPDLSFLPLDKYKMRSRAKPVGPILTSRGCPYGCTFCNKNIFGSRFRAKSPENILEEIEYLVGDFQVRQINFFDDNFNLDLNRAKQILRLIIRRYGNKLFLNFANGMKINNFDDEFIELLQRAGTFKVGFGIESGDQLILRRIQKNYDTESVIPIVRKLQKKI